MPAPEPIQRDQDLQSLCGELSDANLLSLDTEFERTRTYSPRLCLIQIRANDSAYCVDALADLDLSLLWKLIWSPERLKLFHAARQDLELLAGINGAPPAPLMDTQVAAALAGFDSQIGYAALVRQLLNIELEKESTRTDWTQRPLTQRQIEYAVNDVAWLQEIHERLAEKLDSLGRYQWAVEDSARLTDPGLYRVAPERAWEKVKGVGRLEDHEWWRARALAAWRETAAQTMNRPRGWVLADRVLLDLATLRPRDRAELARVPDMPRAVVRKRGDRLISVLDEADDSCPEQVSRPDRRGRPSAEDQAATKKLLGLVRDRANDLKISSELLATRKECAGIVAGKRSLRVLEGWRLEIVGRDLLKMHGLQERAGA